MLNFLLLIKNNIKEILTMAGLAAIITFLYVFKRRGEKIEELEMDEKIRDIKDETKPLENKINELKKETKNVDETFNNAVAKFNASHARFLKFYRDLRPGNRRTRGKGGRGPK